MKTKMVKFTYTHTVSCPADQVGETGETKEMPADVAAHLEAEGYGYTGEKKDDTGDDDSGDDSNGSDEAETPVVPHRRRRKRVDT